jgi:hypothetical protein
MSGGLVLRRKATEVFFERAARGVGSPIVSSLPSLSLFDTTLQNSGRHDFEILTRGEPPNRSNLVDKLYDVVRPPRSARRASGEVRRSPLIASRISEDGADLLKIGSTTALLVLARVVGLAAR